MNKNEEIAQLRKMLDLAKNERAEIMRLMDEWANSPALEQAYRVAISELNKIISKWKAKISNLGGSYT